MGVLNGDLRAKESQGMIDVKTKDLKAFRVAERSSEHGKMAKFTAERKTPKMGDKIILLGVALCSTIGFWLLLVLALGVAGTLGE